MMAQAQDGYVGLSFGDYTADQVGAVNSAHGNSVTLEGLFKFSAGPGALVLEGSYRDDDIDSSVLYGTEMTTQAHLAAHYVYGLGTNATVSGFIGYGKAPHDVPQEDYSLVYAGIGGSYTPSASLAVYGQLGYGDAPNNDETDSSGFYQGEFFRAGMTYTGFQNTAISVEYERAFSSEYEDPEERGSLGSVYLGGATAIGGANYQVTYGVRKSFFDAQNDTDRTEETSVSLGVRYVFGGKAPGSLEREGVLGSPHLPLRASNWVPSLD
jgi:hypothetical protein